MMNARIQVLAVEHKAGVSKTSHQPYQMDVCKCVVHLSDGRVDVGELVLPKDHPKVEPGMYEGHFGIQVGYDKKISGQLIKLSPLPAFGEKSAKAA